MVWKSKKTPDEEGAAPVVHPEDVQIARNAFRQHHDPVHAVNHLATVLEVDCEHHEARTLLEEIIAANPNPLELIKPSENGSISPGQAGIAACIYFKQGEPNLAFSLLNQIYRSVSGLPFLPWLLEWLETIAGEAKAEHQRQSEETLDPAVLQRLLLLISQKFETGLSYLERSQLEKLYPLLNPSRQLFCEPEESSIIAIPLSIIERKLGHIAQAIQLAAMAHSTYPTYMSAVVLGVAYRTDGQVEEALGMYREAVAIQPTNPSVRVDIGEILCEQGQFEEGLTSYRQALELEPNHSWAWPAYLYFRSVVEPEGEWSKKLREYVAAQPDNPQAQRYGKRSGLYLSRLPEPTEAIVNMAQKMLEAGSVPKSLKIGVSSLEAPSAYRAVQLLQQELYGQIDTSLSVLEIQKPDPRQPLGEVDFVLYRYNGYEPEPVLSPPSLTSQFKEVLDLVAELAATPYEAHVWWVKAGKCARTLDFTRLNDLITLMLYPPQRPTEFAMWNWLFRVQVAAAFIIARLDDKGEWQTSHRRRILLSLGRGPMDWTVSAACLALCNILLEEEGTGQEDTDQLYRELLENLPRSGDVSHEAVVLYCAAYIGPSKELARLAQKVIDNSH